MTIIYKKQLLFRMLFSVGTVITAFLFSACKGQKDNTSMEPGTVLTNGKIITVDPYDSIAEAAAIKDCKIMAVGKNALIKKMIGQDTQVIDLNGLTATPGLIDAHCHFAEGGVGMLYILDLGFPEVRKIADVKEKVKAKAHTLKPGEWIIGRGWDEGKLEELRYIYASDLDQVCPNNPVWLLHTMGHYGTANSAAMNLANITKNTPDPPGGSIDRYPDGTPTGVLKESAMDLVARLLPSMTSEQIQEGIIELVKGFNKEGMTAAKDPGIGFDIWEDYQRVLAQDKLNVRMFVLWDGGRTIDYAKNLIDHVGPFTKPYVSTGDDRLISGGIKLYLDGSGGARTGWLYDEWNKNFNDTDKGNYGYPVIEPEIFREMVKMYHNAGLHIGVHAIGDRAIDWVMDSYSEALKNNPIRGLRHSIIHCNIPTDRAIAMMAEMQKSYDAGYPEAEAVHMWWIGDTYAGNFGPKRCLRLKPYKTFLNAGMRWAATSDFFVDPFPARYGIWAQIAREPLLGVYGKHPFGTAESIDVHNALRAYTIWAAHQLFLENKIGSVEVGKYADIAVWDKDIYAIPTKEIKDLKCQMTLFGGKIVYIAQETPIKFSRKGDRR
jgi:predicted amidohydrolase YtcJ